jgi:hypothetical protein
MVIGMSRINNGAQVRSGGIADSRRSLDGRSSKRRVPLAIAYTPSAGPRKMGANVAPVAKYVPTPPTVAMKAARGHTRRVAIPSARTNTAGSTHGDGSTVATIRSGP